MHVVGREQRHSDSPAADLGGRVEVRVLAAEAGDDVVFALVHVSGRRRCAGLCWVGGTQRRRARGGEGGCGGTRRWGWA